MKLQTTALAAALLLSFNAFAEDKATTSTSTDTTTTATDGYVHGQAVRETALRDATGKPVSPPGAEVSAVARTQGDFMRLDANKDGSLSSEELSANAELSAELDTLDLDGDGVLSRTEFNESIASTDLDEDFDDVVDEDPIDEEE